MIYIRKYVIINKESPRKQNLAKAEKVFIKNLQKKTKNVLTLWKQYDIIINVLLLNISTQFFKDKLVKKVTFTIITLLLVYYFFVVIIFLK